ncbi:DUF308 domain-containing protein [Pontibacter beigongshangensis]|uniref:DUF308 domain-containing protein n=1 Tax=Pontibacter beigongshangensis TaxID=2574733 RepID=UPI00164F9484|nr:DUF308 domain-containing protein [Pontibacter beigongshangensis]
MRILGIILIVLGVLAFIYTGFSYTTKETVAEVGPIEINADRERTLSWPPIVGIVLVIGGIVMVVADKRGR